MRDLSQCTVLVVDDTETNIDILVEILGDDYNVSVAMDGESALQDIVFTRPDLILLDIMMPGMDGYEVCKRLKASAVNRKIPVIFVTAKGEVEDETLGFEIGAVDYITKPVSPPIVKARVKNHLELKLAREDLEKQNEILRENARLREEVEQITRHDLKNPLNIVLNVTNLLMMDDNLTPQQVEMLQMLKTSGYRVLEMINMSLDLFKMETGRYQLQPVPVDILKVVAQIKGKMQESVNSKGLAVEVLVRGNPAREADSFVVQGEELLYYSMLSNLIKNAVEASPKGERILIAFDDKESPVISIHNKGAVPPEIRDKFFDKYATSGKKHGTGLGTYSAKLIAETLGGTIRFESSEEAGTTISIQTPKLL